MYEWKKRGRYQSGEGDGEGNRGGNGNVCPDDWAWVCLPVSLFTPVFPLVRALMWEMGCICVCVCVCVYGKEVFFYIHYMY